MPPVETIVAPATPPGESALALLRLTGPLCPQVASGLLRRPTPPPLRRATFGALWSREGQWLDDAVVTLFGPGSSYTGEAVLEISCHGNPLLVRKILEDCLGRGCRLALPGEFTQRAFLAGRIDLTQAEAVGDLIHARSEAALQAAQNQLHGGLGRAIGMLSARVTGILAHFEAYIDFPDEDLPDEDSGGPLAELSQVRLDLAGLLATSRYRGLLEEGLRTVILGPPNAGKSSLINALLGEERALVSPEPGTTRDYLRERFLLGGFSIHIVDTAGLGAPGSDLEARGMERTLEQAGRADFFLLVLDSSLPAPTLPAAVLARLEPRNCLVVENKIDLPTAHTSQTFLPEFEHARVCLLTGQGLEALRAAWTRMLSAGAFFPPPDTLVVGTRHAEALSRADEALAEAQAVARRHGETTLLTVHLREALDHLGEVVGRIDNEAVLDRLFASFCIGK